MPDTPTPSQRDERLERILADYLHAVEAGTAPDRAKLLKQYPDLAADLGSFFRNRDAMEHIGEPIKEQLPALAETIGVSDTPKTGVGTTIRYFGDYELLEEIARGGMGVVYRARQVSLNRIVAIKMILAGQLASEADVQRFNTEAEAAANLDHPNIVPIYEVGEHEGQHYFSMKLIVAGSLAAWMQTDQCAEGAAKHGEKKPWHAAASARVKLLVQVARAVHHAHQRGILHRDLKPANILIDAAGEPQVTDFGLAKRMEGDKGLTQVGAIVGTPSYMAPEQASGAKGMTTAVDVYSLGAILYELLTGRPPFLAATPLDTILAVLEKQPVSLRALEPRIDRDLETICLKCLEKVPERRYDSAAALADELERWLRHEPILARPSTVFEKAVKWVKRQQAAAGLWAACILVSLVAVMALAGASKLVSALLLSACWVGIFLYVLRRQSLLRDAQGEEEPPPHLKDSAVRKKLNNPSFRTKVVIGMVGGAWTAGMSMPLWQAAGYDLGWGLMALSALIGAMIGALFGAAIRAFRQPVANPLNFGLISLVLVSMLSRYDWASIRSYIWIWFGLIIGVTIAALIAAARPKILGLQRILGPKVSNGILHVAVILGLIGSVVFFWAILGGQIGNASAGRLGLVAGQLLSAFLGGALVAVILPRLTAQEAEDYSYQGDSGLALLFLAMTNVSILWFIFADSPAGIEVRRLEFPNYVRAVVCSPNGRLAALLCNRQPIRLWDVESGQVVRLLKADSGDFVSAAFSADGSHLLSENEDGSARLWDVVQTGEELRRFTGPSKGVCIAFSADGEFGLSRGENNTVTLWNLNSAAEVRSFSGHTDSIRSVAFSPDGRRLLSGSYDHTMRLWDVESGREIGRFERHTGPVRCVAFLPDGRRALAGYDDWTIRLWDLVSGQELHCFEGHQGSVDCLAVSRDGRSILSGSVDQTMRLWEMESGAQRCVFRGHDSVFRAHDRDRHSSVDSLSFCGDSRMVLSGSDKTIRLWEARE